MNIQCTNNPILLICLVFINGLLLASCATPPSSLQSDYVPPGSLRLAEVMSVGKRNEIVQIKPAYDVLIANGISDAQIVDGSVALARIYCCGGVSESLSSEFVHRRMLFVPKGIDVSRGDVVEVRAGNPPTEDNPSRLNIVTRIVQNLSDENGTCWWDPKNPKLWLRVLYCDWMPREGWIKQDGLHPAWFKPVILGSSGN